nr:hypothetical protein GCM10020063_063910 [Dactylosporangium thailandense]
MITQTSSVYDTLGRLTSYTDSAGAQTINTYDLFSRLATVNDGLATRTYTYDQSGENRGLLTQVVDSQGGTFTGTYDAEKRLVTEGRPNSIAVTRAYNEVGTPTTVTSTASDRTSLALYNPGTGGVCQSTTVASTRTWTYDTASRSSSAGYVYDALGRATTVPATDTQSPGAGNLTATYNVNDLVSTLTQNGGTSSFVIDVDGARCSGWNDGVNLHVNQYPNAGTDNPAWTNEGDGTSTRTLVGVGGLTGTAGSGGITWRLTDVSGDVAGTVAAGVGLDSTSEATEYGALRNPTQVGTVRYAWQGGARRAADQPGGIVLMGVRLYNPATGALRAQPQQPLAGDRQRAQRPRLDLVPRPAPQLQRLAHLRGGCRLIHLARSLVLLSGLPPALELGEHPRPRLDRLTRA